MSHAGRQLFVGNLPFIVESQDLQDLFRNSGSILRAEVATTPAGRSRGFGTVLFATPQDALDAAESFNGFEWHGRKIEVREDRAPAGGNPREFNNGGGFSGANGAPAYGAALAPGAPVRPVRPVQPFAAAAGAAPAGPITIRALYVGNLPYSVGWQDLKDLFREAGNVIRADIPTDWQGRSKGFGTITMGSVEEARKAAATFAGYEWNGRRLDVREDRSFVEGAAPANVGVIGGNPGVFVARPPRPHSVDQGGAYNNANLNNFNGPRITNLPSSTAGTAGRQLFIGNLPFTVQWQELKDMFREAGNVQRADVAQDQQGRSRGYGQVLMATVEEAQAAISNLNGRELQGRTIEVREDKYANEPGNSTAGTQIFVGNLPYSIRWQDLKDLFRPHGLNPVHADIMAEPNTGRSKGCGIVRFATADEAQRAVTEVNGSPLAGRNVIIRLDKFA